eukprot:scaffold16388_cov61-Phaeocystis_antarctica.AAC.2
MSLPLSVQVITYSYMGLVHADGGPRFPSIRRVDRYAVHLCLGCEGPSIVGPCRVRVVQRVIPNYLSRASGKRANPIASATRVLLTLTLTLTLTPTLTRRVHNCQAGECDACALSRGEVPGKVWPVSADWCVGQCKTELVRPPGWSEG